VMRPFMVNDGIGRISVPLISSADSFERIEFNLAWTNRVQGSGVFIEAGGVWFQPIVLADWMVQGDWQHILQDLLEIQRSNAHVSPRPARTEVLVPKAQESNARSIKLEGIIK